jgi:hypothetical protein
MSGGMLRKAPSCSCKQSLTWNIKAVSLSVTKVLQLLKVCPLDPPMAQHHSATHSNLLPRLAGGSAVAEWLTQNLFNVVGEHWQGGNAPEACINDAYTQADKQLLVSKGFMGLGELPGRSNAVQNCHLVK